MKTIGTVNSIGERSPIASNNIPLCATCGVSITPSNDSGWQVFVSSAKTQPMCRVCNDHKPTALKIVSDYLKGTSDKWVQVLVGNKKRFGGKEVLIQGFVSSPCEDILLDVGDSVFTESGFIPVTTPTSLSISVANLVDVFAFGTTLISSVENMRVVLAERITRRLKCVWTFIDPVFFRFNDERSECECRCRLIAISRCS